MTQPPDLDKMRRHSHLEFTLWHQLDQAGIPMPQWQYRINGPHNTKGHKVDFCWPELHIIVEVQGGTWSRGAHTRGKGYAADRLRALQYQLDGWTVCEFTAEHVNSNTALAWILEAMDL